MGDWQDISTAPRDGTPVLAFWPQVEREDYRTKDLPGVFLTAWIWGDWQIVDAQQPYRTIPRAGRDIPDAHASPTHWMPLPEPPR